MAKSIRSKCKRKARAEFRRTIGTDFDNKKKKEVQDKLKETLAKQNSMKSLDRIADLLDAGQPEEVDEVAEAMETTGVVAVDALETVRECNKGENQAPVKRRSSRKIKHSLNPKAKKAAPEKRRPKYFVQF